MRRLIFTLFIFLLTISNCWSQQNSFTIDGDVDGLQTEMLVLERQTPDPKNFTYDTIYHENGKFKFVGRQDYLVFAVIWFDFFPSGQPRKGFRLYLENANFKINGYVENDKLMQDHILITGTKTEKEYYEFEDTQRPLRRVKDSLEVAYRDAKEKKDSMLMDLVTVQYQNNSADFMENRKRFILNHPNSFVSLYELNLYRTRFNFDEFATLYNNLSEYVKNSVVGFDVKNFIETSKKLSIGGLAVDFTQPDLDGNNVSLRNFRGKYLLLDFWASSCKPCRLENPNLVKLYEKYKKDGFEILGVSYDMDKRYWKRAILADHLTWTNVGDLKGMENEAIKLYGVTSFPTSYLINPQGVIVKKNIRGEDLKNELEKIFGY